MERLAFTATTRDDKPWADEIVRLPGVSVAEAVAALQEALPGGFASTSDTALADALLSAGAQSVRHAHQMRLALPLADSDDTEFLPFAPDATPPVPWVEVLPAFLAAYPPEHPDHLPGGASLITDYLVPYTSGGRLGSLVCHSSAIALREGYAYGGILVVDRPGEGAWVCDIWRDPNPEYAGTGAALLRWAAARLTGHASLGLVVTVGNDAALRAYERVGFAIESTAWTVRLP
jgi:ribosomal protein S18 acetylase RimI-like enzyme